MKVFVTGGAGYIGSISAETLLDAGHEVVVFDNLERGHAEAVDPRAEFVKGDLRDRVGILAAMKAARPDAVMHFAAYALVGESMVSPELYWGNNVVGGLNLAEAMLKLGVDKIVFSSTCATYGMPRRIPMTEDHPQAPANPYGISKLMFENVLIWNEALRGMKPVFLRYFNAAGATGKYGEDHDPESHLIPIVLQTAIGHRKNVVIHGDDYDTPDGTCIRDYVHISDLAQAHLLAIEKGVTGGFNLGNGEGYSVKEVLQAAREVTGREIPAAVGPRRPGDPDRLVACSTKAKEKLGWKPARAELKTIIESAWLWHQAHPRGYSG
ncbi:MAG: UDP-glucose 4-epimerase GalE [Lentisphaerales bacterium]|jgi:UDP-glucose 4-epimerase|nr:MAG: UDP-glucose 4-epimerase GalE [Lentisphaerales bacterium]